MEYPFDNNRIDYIKSIRCNSLIRRRKADLGANVFLTVLFYKLHSHLLIIREIVL